MRRPGSCRTVLGTLLLCGCGDPLAGGGYQGEVLLDLPGKLSVNEAGRGGDRDPCRQARAGCMEAARGDCAGTGPGCPATDACLEEYDACLEEAQIGSAPWEEADTTLRVSLFWAGGEAAAPGERSALEQSVAATGSFPLGFELAVRTPPPAEALRDAEAGPYGLAVVLVYLDEGDDGWWTSHEDRIVGGASRPAVLYAPGGLDGAHLGTWAPGHHVVDLDPGCGGGSKLGLTPAEAPFLDLQLSVVPDHLDALLPDLDCDPGTVDWWICPPAGASPLPCAPEAGPPPDAWRCALCGKHGPGGGGPGPGPGGPGGPQGPPL